MAETITPVVHGGRNRRYLFSVVLHVVGAGLAAAAVGALAGAIGAVLGAPWGRTGAIAVASLAGIYLVKEAFGVPVPVPALKRQVPDWWRTFFSPPTTALLYGLGLGVAFFTHLRSGTFIVVTLVAIASGEPLLGAALCAPFGIARGLSVLVSCRTDDGAGASSVVDRLEDLGATRFPSLANSIVLAAIALALLLAF